MAKSLQPPQQTRRELSGERADHLTSSEVSHRDSEERGESINSHNPLEKGGQQKDVKWVSTPAAIHGLWHILGAKGVGTVTEEGNTQKVPPSQEVIRV